MESRIDIAPTARRWVVLIAYMLVTLACEIQWLAHASVARAANAFYAGQFDAASLLNVDALALLYMVVYLALCIPASRIIDSKGIRVGIGIGAVLVVLGSIVKAVGGRSFAAQLAGQFVLAVSQPFIINATTALTVRWFPLRERGLAAGLASLAQYLGFIVALGVTPLMVAVDPSLRNYGSGMDRALWVYGAFSVLAGVAALLFIKENPEYRGAARSADAAAYGGILKSYRAIFAKPDMIRTLMLFLIGLGVMNALTSMTDSVAGSIGAKDSDGLIGVAMIFGGVIGAIVVPTLSDKFRRRKPFIVLCAALMIPGVAGLAFVKNLNPYRYSWRVAEAPAGAAVSIRQDIPHPQFTPADAGRYVFDFALSGKKDGTELERKAVTVEAKAGQVLLLDGTERDDRVIGTIYIAALAAAFIFGFAVMSAGPLGFQYAAEVSHPAPEAASQGALLLVGQVSGIIFTAGMSMRKNLYLDLFLVLFVVLSVLMLILAARLGESPLIVTEAEKYS